MRRLVVAVWALSALVVLGGCPDEAQDQVVLYSSVDETYLRPILEDFEASTGIRVRYVGDTEATKTFGLVERLIDERDDPRADVWWSSEHLGSIRLSELGVLSAHRAEGAEGAFSAGWPSQLRGGGPEGMTWYGFALRGRVFVVNTEHVDASFGATLGSLTDPSLRGRVGIANPRFGTTRAHMGAILAAAGEEAFVAWLEALVANDVRVLPGNSDVVRAVATGEIYVGLTDTDDVYAGRARDWPIGLRFEALGMASGDDADPIVDGMGSVLIPNTAALVAGGPNPANARVLLDYILSPRVERLLAESESGNMPVHPRLAEEFAGLRIPDASGVSMGEAAESMDRAIELCVEVLGL